MTDIQIDQYYKQYQELPVIDVRSPGEFEKGHMPGAHNIPLFSNTERAHVGTVYKQQGSEKAIELGYLYVNPKLDLFIKEALAIAPNKHAIVHCWRGGMRSHAFANHLSTNGFNNVKVIEKGYKAYRKYVLSSFKKEVNLKVIGGFTGSGKTHILHHLHQTGHQVINLELIANHKGSAFGAIGEKDQPTVEQFENNLFKYWEKLNYNKPVYIEDESHNIGGVKLPMSLYTTMRKSNVYFLDIPKEKRAQVLVGDYGGHNNEQLKASILKITKRLGGLVTQQALKALSQQNYFKVAMLMLNYYDKSYLKGIQKRDTEQIIKIKRHSTNPIENANHIIQYIENKQL